MLKLLKKLFIPPFRWLRGKMSPPLFGPMLFPFFLFLFGGMVHEMVDGACNPNLYPQLMGTDCQANWDERCTNFFLSAALWAAWSLLGMLCSLGLGFFKNRFLWYAYLSVNFYIFVTGCLMG